MPGPTSLKQALNYVHSEWCKCLAWWMECQEVEQDVILIQGAAAGIITEEQESKELPWSIVWNLTSPSVDLERKKLLLIGIICC